MKTKVLNGKYEVYPYKIMRTSVRKSLLLRLYTIKNIVSDITGLDIAKKDRKRQYVYARSIFANLARKYTIYTLDDMAKEINVNHSTVSYYLEIHYDLMRYEDYRDKYNTSLEAIRETLKQF